GAAFWAVQWPIPAYVLWALTGVFIIWKPVMKLGEARWAFTKGSLVPAVLVSLDPPAIICAAHLTDTEGEPEFGVKREQVAKPPRVTALGDIIPCASFKKIPTSNERFFARDFYPEPLYYAISN